MDLCWPIHLRWYIAMPCGWPVSTKKLRPHHHWLARRGRANLRIVAAHLPPTPTATTSAAGHSVHNRSGTPTISDRAMRATTWAAGPVKARPDHKGEADISGQRNKESETDRMRDKAAKGPRITRDTISADIQLQMK